MAATGASGRKRTRARPAPVYAANLPKVPARVYDESVMLTKREAADSLRVGLRTLEELITAGAIPSIKVRNRRLIWRPALHAYAARLHEEQGFAEYAGLAS